MDNLRNVDSPSVHEHRRQLTWQILVPICVATALILAVAVFVATGIVSGTRTWADVSTIWLIAPMLVFTLVGVILLGFLIFATAKLLQVLPHYSGRIQDFFGLLSMKTHSIANGAAKPFIWVQQAGAMLKSIFKL